MTTIEPQQLLPHRGDALWLQSIQQHSPHSISGCCNLSCLHGLQEISSLMLFEAAAQLCAAHGALYAGNMTIKAAHIGKVTAVRSHAPLQLGLQKASLQATLLCNSTTSASYSFSIHQQDNLLVDGKLLLVLTHA